MGQSIGIMSNPETGAGDWRHQAVCRDEDPELFFPVDVKNRAGMRQLEDAKAVCNRCSVIDICLKWAMETGQDAGVWGGMGEDERRALRRRQARRSMTRGQTGMNSEGYDEYGPTNDGYIGQRHQQPPDDDF